MAEVTVIIPIYNAETYLRQCIDSVLSQTFTDWRMILVDDGSNDDSNTICREYTKKDQRITIIEKSNGGPSSARNAALDIVDTPYLTFLDADDELYPTALEVLCSVAKKYSSSIVIGKFVNSYIMPLPREIKPMVRIESPEKVLTDALFQKSGSDNSVCWKLFETKLFDDLHFYDGWYEDLEIFPKLLKKAERIALTNQLVYFYRKHKKSFINSWSDGRCDIVRVTADLINDASDDGGVFLKAARHRHFSACYNVLLGLLHYSPENTELVNYCYREIRSLRTEVLFGQQSRLKNRLGALISLAGKSFLKLLS